MPTERVTQLWTPRVFTPVHIRWLIERDMTAVLSIERASFDSPWTQRDFLTALRRQNCIGMVAEDRAARVLGFMVYELHADYLEVVNLAVKPIARRVGVGSQLVAKLMAKLSSHRRASIGLNVREENLPAQLFLRSAGFRATSVLRSHYGPGSDAYRMEYRGV